MASGRRRALFAGAGLRAGAAPRGRAGHAGDRPRARRQRGRRGRPAGPGRRLPDVRRPHGRGPPPRQRAVQHHARRRVRRRVDSPTATTCWPSSASATVRCGAVGRALPTSCRRVPPRAERKRARRRAADPAGSSAWCRVPAADLQPPPRRPQPARGTGSRSGCATIAASASSTTRATGATSSRTGRRWLHQRARPSSADGRGLPGRHDRPTATTPTASGAPASTGRCPSPTTPGATIGYWGDHQMVYLLRLLEAARPPPGALAGAVGPRAVQLRRRPLPAAAPHRAVAHPKHTIDFDHERPRGAPSAAPPDLGADGLLVCMTPPGSGAGQPGREAGLVIGAGQGRQPRARRRPVAAHPAAGVERRQQRAGGQRPVGGDAGAPAAPAGLVLVRRCSN
jgi:hypothetical protein